MARKRTVTVSLTEHQVAWLDGQDKSRSELVRDALRNEYEITND